MNIAALQARVLVGPLILFATPEQTAGRVFSSLLTASTMIALLATLREWLCEQFAAAYAATLIPMRLQMNEGAITELCRL
jgi:hypothetical protein